MRRGIAHTMTPTPLAADRQERLVRKRIAGSKRTANLVVVDDTEDLDYDSTLLFSGGINPLNLPKKIVDGNCVPSYPHSRVRVNTVFEVVQSKGQQTAYTDKHPAYDLVRGPSGTGLTTGYFPEIAAIKANDVPACIAYDQYHVNAFLDWLDAATPANSEGHLSSIPALFGGNFQSGKSMQSPDVIRL